VSGAGARSGPARGAVLRWAWRLFRREWRQQLVMLALVTVAVAAAVAGATMAVNATSSGNGQFGDARAVMHLDATDPAPARASVAAARARFGQLEVIGHTAVAVPGSSQPLDLRTQDPHGAYGRPMLALRAGRYPATAGEVALTSREAKLLSARIGAVVDLGGVERTVVGLVENPSDLADQFALVAPAAEPSADSWTVLLGSATPLRGAAPPPQDDPAAAHFKLNVRGDDHKAVVALVLVATTLAMALVCLVAAAGFVVVAQRRQRQLGLLAAIGATQRHLRLVTLANGVIVGATSAAVGGALGLLGWIAAAPAVEAAAGHRIGRLDVPWGLVGACMAIAVLVATAAAWWPARAMARLPVMAALSGRPARPSPVHRSLAVALALSGIGAGAIAASRPTGDVRPLVLVGGILAAVVGVVFASPAAIRALGSPAARLPFAARLALRDLVRHQARAAAALAAITLVLGISVSMAVVAKAGEYRSDEGNLSSRQLAIWVGDQRNTPDPSLSASARATLDGGAARVAAALGAPTMLTLDVAMNPSTTTDPSGRDAIAVVTPMPHGFRGVGFAYVATPELLRRYGIDPSKIDDATDLLTSLPGDVQLLDAAVRPDPGAPQGRVQRVDLSAYTSAPTSLVTESAMRRHGWVAARAGWLVEPPKPLTTEQIAAARAAAATAGLAIETRSGQDGLATLRTVATTVGGLLALAIVAMTIGLIRSESVRDLRTLTATGAAARTRRTLTAATAGALAVLGVVLSTGGAYVALVAAYHADLGKLAAPPVLHLVLLALGLPAVAAGAGWLLAGHEPRTFARQALD
jgi:putative ABC transport system permease protein